MALGIRLKCVCLVVATSGTVLSCSRHRSGQSGVDTANATLQAAPNVPRGFADYHLGTTLTSLRAKGRHPSLEKGGGSIVISGLVWVLPSFEGVTLYEEWIPVREAVKIDAISGFYHDSLAMLAIYFPPEAGGGVGCPFCKGLVDLYGEPSKREAPNAAGVELTHWDKWDCCSLLAISQSLGTTIVYFDKPLVAAVARDSTARLRERARHRRD